MTGGPAGPAGFMHAALLYRSDAEYAQAVMGMVGADDACGTCVALVGTGPRDGLVRDALRVTASAVTFADIIELGRDPARSRTSQLAVQTLITVMLYIGAAASLPAIPGYATTRWAGPLGLAGRLCRRDRRRVRRLPAGSGGHRRNVVVQRPVQRDGCAISSPRRLALRRRGLLRGTNSDLARFDTVRWIKPLTAP